jgi:murein DD-endopeptidase MepM/ murein hydrolase activator NlpD
MERMVARGSGALLALVCAATLVQPVTASEGRRRSVVRHRAGKAPLRGRPVHRAAAVGTASGIRGTVEEHVHVRRGDNLGRLLVARGVGGAEAVPWLAAAADVYDLRQLRPRRGVSLRFDRATHTLQAIRYEIDDQTLLVLDKGADGRIRAERTALPYFTEVKGMAGAIEHGLREDATESGIPPRVVSELADIFGWELDVATGLGPGDEFRVLYENIWQTGAPAGEPGNVLGAEIVRDGLPLTAVFFEDADGHGAYYQPNGEPLSRDLLRYPLEFTEITSEFSLFRRHPVLHLSRPHLGVDFAAPVGTPVRAVARGTVNYSGWVKSLGRCVRIDHASALESTYGHLARIASGIEPGTPVERGQVIGYVGASGLATGPHLHFAIYRDGEYVDPLEVTAAAEAPIPDRARRAFERVQQAVTHQLETLPKTASPLTVSLSETGFPRE